MGDLGSSVPRSEGSVIMKRVDGEGRASERTTDPGSLREKGRAKVSML